MRHDHPSKQERRGGIETDEISEATQLHPARSRNAVVALKRQNAPQALVDLVDEAGTPWWH